MKIIPQLFSFNDLKDKYKTPSYFSSFVYRAIKKGEIKQIKKGLYAMINPTTNLIFASKFQIACRLFKDAYLSYHEALEYYGLANQSFVSICNFLTKSHSRDLIFEGVTYKSKKSKHDICIRNRMEEEGIRVVTLERAIIDSIDCISLSGGFEEVEYALSNINILNWNDILSILRFYNKKYLYQKVGYLFETHFGNNVPKEFYCECLNHIGNTIIYFESNKGKSMFNSRWKLMVKEEKELPYELF